MDIKNILPPALAVAFIFTSVATSADASTLTFNFDASYSAASYAQGDTSNLFDTASGLSVGQIFHGSFSYDPSLPPTSTYSDPFFQSASYGGGTFAFSLPSGTLTINPASYSVQLSSYSFDPFDRFITQSQPNVVSTAAGGEILTYFGFSLSDSTSTTLTTLSAPTSLDLSKFDTAYVFTQAFEFDASSNFVGQYYREFDLTSLTAAVPEPSTWAMMLLGFCGLGFMTYRPAGSPLGLPDRTKMK